MSGGVTRLRLLAAVGIAGLSLFAMLGFPRWPVETTLPNGFVIQGDTVVLSRDRRTVLSEDAEFICFDDRFLSIISLDGGRKVLFDNRSQDQVDVRSHPEITAPGGLLHGDNGCNGYHTRMMGPGLLHDNGEWPFIPSCESVNMGNLILGDRAWLNRPCATR